MKLGNVLKVLSAITTILVTAGEVLKQINHYQELKNSAAGIKNEDIKAE